MRKEARIGLAVGGIVVTGVVAFAVFFTGGPGEKPKPAPTAPQPGTVAQAPAAEAPGTPTAPDGRAPRLTLPPPTVSSPDHDNTVAVGNPAISSPPVVTTTPPVTGAATPAPADLDVPVVSATPGSFNWSSALDHGAPLPRAVRSETPSMAGMIPTGADTPVSGLPSFGTPATTTPSVVTSSTPTSPTTPAAHATGRTYSVKTGETYWKIAQAEYGNGAYYTHLVRANPKIPASKLKAGSIITIPDRSEVTATASTGATARPATRPAVTTIDHATQYRVQTGDNLYTISKKLYGKIDRVDKLYELNKAAIGPNPAVLKLNMFLKLPEPPTTTSGMAGAH